MSEILPFIGLMVLGMTAIIVWLALDEVREIPPPN
jgi:hypothetical protein